MGKGTGVGPRTEPTADQTEPAYVPQEIRSFLTVAPKLTVCSGAGVIHVSQLYIAIDQFLKKTGFALISQALF